MSQLSEAPYWKTDIITVVSKAVILSFYPCDERHPVTCAVPATLQIASLGYGGTHLRQECRRDAFFTISSHSGWEPCQQTEDGVVRWLLPLQVTSQDSRLKDLRTQRL